MHRKYFFILVFLVLTTSCSLRHQSDELLIEKLTDNKADFEQLVLLVSQYEEAGVITSEDQVSESESELATVIELLKKLKLRSVEYRTHENNGLSYPFVEIEASYNLERMAYNETWKGFIYFLDNVPTSNFFWLGSIKENLDYTAFNTPRGAPFLDFFKPIENYPSWYLYFYVDSNDS